jgi:hypothetical protein
MGRPPRSNLNMHRKAAGDVIVCHICVEVAILTVDGDREGRSMACKANEDRAGVCAHACMHAWPHQLPTCRWPTYHMLAVELWCQHRGTFARDGV